MLETLKPFTTDAGGPLKVSTHEYVDGRPNVLIEYNSEAAETGETRSLQLGPRATTCPCKP